MNCLLDTHTYLWWLGDTARVGEEARKQIAMPSNSIYVSLTTFWEMAVKISLGKLTLSQDLSQLAAELPDDGMKLLPISTGHCVTVARLPFHHGDPFDRMLISQALHDGLTLLSCDHHFESYPVTVVW